MRTKNLSYRPNPTQDARVRKVWRGILRDKGEAVGRKRPTLINDIRKMMTTLPEGLGGIRDRAVILFAFAGALRRSECVAINFGDLELGDDGFILRINRSKTDQTGRGRKVGIPYGQYKETCPVRAMLAWLSASGIDRGAVFRKVNRHGDLEGERLTDKSVALIVKRAAKLAGINPRHFASHSLRAGLATAAAIAGVDERARSKIRRATRASRCFARIFATVRSGAATPRRRSGCEGRHADRLFRKRTAGARPSRYGFT